MTGPIPNMPPVPRSFLEALMVEQEIQRALHAQKITAGPTCVICGGPNKQRYGPSGGLRCERCSENAV